MTIESRVQRLEDLVGEQHGHAYDQWTDEQLRAELDRLEAGWTPIRRWTDAELAAAWERFRRERLSPLALRRLSDEALELRVAAYQWAVRQEQGAILIGSEKDQA